MTGSLGLSTARTQPVNAKLARAGGHGNGRPGLLSRAGLPCTIGSVPHTLACSTLHGAVMTETVGLSDDRTIILVRSDGAPSVGEMKRTIAKIVELRREHRIGRVLVDSRARTVQPSILDIYEGGELLASMLGGEPRVAVLVGEIAPGHTFFQNVTFNRGSVVAYFQDYAKAVQWLAQDDGRELQEE